MKIKVTLSLDDESWRAFRGECIKRKELASTLVEGFIQEQLKKWQGVEEPPKRKPRK